MATKEVNFDYSQALNIQSADFVINDSLAISYFNQNYKLSLISTFGNITYQFKGEKNSFNGIFQKTGGWFTPLVEGDICSITGFKDINDSSIILGDINNIVYNGHFGDITGQEGVDEFFDKMAGFGNCLLELLYTQAVTGITVEPTNAIINIGDTLDLKAEVFPDDATNKNLIWTSSSNPTASVVPISDTVGRVTGLNEGEVFIFANSESNPSVRGYSTIEVIRETTYYPLASRELPNDRKYTSFNDTPKRTTGIRKNNEIVLFDPLEYGEYYFETDINNTPCESANFTPYNNIPISLYDFEYLLYCKTVTVVGLATIVFELKNDDYIFNSNSLVMQVNDKYTKGDEIEITFPNFGVLKIIYDGSIGDIIYTGLPGSSMVLSNAFHNFDGLLVIGFSTTGDSGNFKYRALDGLKQLPLVESKVD